MAVEIINSKKDIAFDCVDHWRGTLDDYGMVETATKHDIFKEFRYNMQHGGVWDRIHVKKKSSVRASWDYQDDSLDFVFIDGAHDQGSVEADILAWWPKVKVGGVLAGHDYYGDTDQQVVDGVNNLLAGRFTTFGKVDRSKKQGQCWLVTKTADMAPPDKNKFRPRAFLYLPNRPGNAFDGKTVDALWQTGSRHRLHVRSRAMSLLNYNFNLGWCDALNRRGEFEYFVMMHSDICPEPRWLDKLIDEYERSGADVLSCVVAIKDERGQSSTGLMTWHDRNMKKISIAQALKLPPTFNAAMIGYPKDVLLINTGLWICRMDKKWCEKVCFRCYDRIFQDADGTFVPQCIGEDWLFSIDLAKLGVKVFATTAIKVLHAGGFDYPNFTPWGDTDDVEMGFAWDVSGPAIHKNWKGELHEQEEPQQSAGNGTGGSNRVYSVAKQERGRFAQPAANGGPATSSRRNGKGRILAVPSA